MSQDDDFMHLNLVFQPILAQNKERFHIQTNNQCIFCPRIILDSPDISMVTQCPTFDGDKYIFDPESHGVISLCFKYFLSWIFCH